MKRILTILYSALLAFSVEAISVTITVVKQPICTYASGELTAVVSGGTEPYSYAWNTGAVTRYISGLLAGDYSVTVTDSNQEQATADVTLTTTDYGILTSDWFNFGMGLCSGTVPIGFRPEGAGIPGPPPYYVDGVEMQEELAPHPDVPGEYVTYYRGYVNNPQYGQFTYLSFADGNGCPGFYGIPIGWPIQWPTLTTMSIQGACVGTTSGSITIQSSGEGHQQFVQTRISPEVPGYPGHSTGGGPHAFTITGLAAGSYTLTQFMTDTPFFPSSQCSSTFNFTIPQLGAECGTVSGTVFIDNDQDCEQDAGEVGVPNTVLELLPGPQYRFTDGTGAFSMQLVNGSYTLGVGDPTLVQLCPTTVPAPFTLNFNPVVLNIADSSTVALNLRAHMTATAMRPGFPGAYWGKVRNLSPQVSGEVTVTMVIDPALTYDGATPPPTDVTGNTVTWEFGSFGPYQSENLTVNVQVPPGTPLGSVLNSTLTVSNTLGDANLVDNTASLNGIVTGSFDPNDKTGLTDATRSGSQFVLGEDAWIDYTVRFQNTGTDTAFTVVVRDTLDTDLDITSIQLLGASHAFVPSFGDDRELVFTFNDILLPDSTTDLLGSQGYVSFRIKPRADIQVGEVIQNTAGIYFDFNEPVITDTVTHVVELETAVAEVPAGRTMRLAPNPTDDVLLVMEADANAVLEVLASDGRRMAVPFRRVGTMVRMDVKALSPGLYLVRSGQDIARFVKR